MGPETFLKFIQGPKSCWTLRSYISCPKLLKTPNNYQYLFTILWPSPGKPGHDAKWSDAVSYGVCHGVRKISGSSSGCDTFSIQIIATYSLLWPKATIPSDFFDLCDLYLWRVSVPWWSVSSTVEQNVVDYLRGGKTVEGECLTSPSLSRMLKMVSHLHSLRYSPNDEMTND